VEISGAAEPEWLHYVLEPDAENPERGPDGALLDTALWLAGRDNRVALWRGIEAWETTPGAARAVVDLRLRCVAHPHPECRFDWVRLMADFSALDGEILDLEPRNAPADHASPRENLPDVFSSGLRLPAVTWDFRARPGRPMHLDCDLRVLAAVSAAHARAAADVRFIIRARVAVEGVLRAIPVIGRRTAGYDVTG